MLITVLTSTVLAAIIAALVSLLTTERRIAVENVTQERAKWRARVREMADETQSAIVGADEPKLRQLRSKFALVLNPHDSDDRGILNAISLTATAPTRGNRTLRSSLIASLCSSNMTGNVQSMSRAFGSACCDPSPRVLDTKTFA
jgi:hypothetical protein